MALVLMAALLLQQDAELDKKVAALIARLDAEELQERDRAQGEIAALGPAVKARLEAAAAKASPEAATRLRAILDGFAWDELFKASLPPVVRITLEKKPRTPEEIFALIREKTGWPLRVASMNVREPVDLGWTDATALQVIDDVCRALGRGRAMSNAISGSRSGMDMPGRGRPVERMITIDGSRPPSPAIGYSGQFRVEVVDVTIMETRDYNDTKTQASLQLQLTAQPGTKVVRTGRWLVDEIVDEHGASLKAEGPMGPGREPDPELGESRTMVSFGEDVFSYDSFGLNISFNVPKAESGKIARLKARIRVTVPGREVVETRKVSDLKTEGEIRIGDAAIVITKAEKQGQQFTVNYRIEGKYTGRPTLEPLDENGRTLHHMGGGSGGGGGSWSANWHIRNEEISALRVKATVGQRTMEIPFELKDIPLPKGD